jgi:hypothetical protein
VRLQAKILLLQSLYKAKYSGSYWWKVLLYSGQIMYIYLFYTINQSTPNYYNFYGANATNTPQHCRTQYKMYTVYCIRSETVINDRAVLYARPETVRNHRRKKLFYFSFCRKKHKKVESVSDQNKALLQVSRKSVGKNGFWH